MNKEEEKQLGEPTIVVTNTDKGLVLKGTISDLKQTIARTLIDVLDNTIFYETRLSRNANSTSLIFIDVIGEAISIDELSLRIDFMKHATNILSDIMKNLQTLHHLGKDYEGSKNYLKNKESIR